MHFWLSVGRPNECIFGLGFKARVGFFWRFVHALLNAFGGSKFGGLIWKKKTVLCRTLNRMYVGG